tara:strand:+ start:29 stop:166 length:138 start_codon:yes stop_codon:yes gene_type:complete
MTSKADQFAENMVHQLMSQSGHAGNLAFGEDFGKVENWLGIYWGT